MTLVYKYLEVYMHAVQQWLRRVIITSSGSSTPLIVGILMIIVLVGIGLMGTQVLERRQQSGNSAKKPITIDKFKPPHNEGTVSLVFNVEYIPEGAPSQISTQLNFASAACSTPTSFTTSGISQTTATITWAASTPPSGWFGYRITRTGGAQGVVSKDIQSGPVFNDSGLSPGTQYSYSIVNRCEAGDSAPLTGSVRTLGSTTAAPATGGAPTAAPGASRPVRSAPVVSRPPVADPRAGTGCEGLPAWAPCDLSPRLPLPLASRVPSASAGGGSSGASGSAAPVTVDPGSLELVPPISSGLPKLTLPCSYMSDVCKYIKSKGGRMVIAIDLALKDESIMLDFSCGAGNSFCLKDEKIGVSSPIPCTLNDAFTKYCEYIKKSGDTLPQDFLTRFPTATGSATPSGSLRPGASGVASPSASSSGRPIATDCKADIPALVSSISESNMRTNLTEMIDDDSKPGRDTTQSRHVMFNHNVEAEYVKKYYETAGIQVEEQLVPQANNTKNIIATLPGQNASDIYVLIGHLDTRGDFGRFDGRNQVAPGADDNGSGSVALMEIARAIKSSGACLKNTIKVVHTTGHEMDAPNLYGTKDAANKLAAENDILGVINIDMIGYGAGIKVMYNSARPGEKVMAEKVVSMNTKYNIGLNTEIYDSTQPSDHVIFSAMGIPSVFTFEADFTSNPNYHAPTDTIGYLNFGQITKDAKMVVAAITTLARGE